MITRRNFMKLAAASLALLAFPKPEPQRNADITVVQGSTTLTLPDLKKAVGRNRGPFKVTANESIRVEGAGETVFFKRGDVVTFTAVEGKFKVTRDVSI